MSSRAGPVLRLADHSLRGAITEENQEDRDIPGASGGGGSSSSSASVSATGIA